jgi:hypothetical protein
VTPINEVTVNIAQSDGGGMSVSLTGTLSIYSNEKKKKRRRKFEENI